jgi:hypothetical protein
MSDAQYNFFLVEFALRKMKKKQKNQENVVIVKDFFVTFRNKIN